MERAAYNFAQEIDLKGYLKTKIGDSGGKIEQHPLFPSMDYRIVRKKYDNIEPVMGKRKTFLSPLRRKKTKDVFLGYYRFAPKVISETRFVVAPENGAVSIHASDTFLPSEQVFPSTTNAIPFVDNFLTRANEQYNEWKKTDVCYSAKDLYPRIEPGPIKKQLIRFKDFLIRVKNKWEHMLDDKK